MKNFHQVFTVFLAIVLFIFAILQYNDPDSFLWIVIYGLSGLIGILTLFGRIRMFVYPIFLIACILGAFFTWPDQYVGLKVSDGDWTMVELARESLGLVFCALCITYFWLVGRKKFYINQQ